MAFTTTVVVGNITNLSEARYCAGMGVDYLAFPAHRIDPQTFREITAWVTGPVFILDVSQTDHPSAALAQYEADHVLFSSDQAMSMTSLLEKTVFIKMNSTLSISDFQREMQRLKPAFVVIEKSKIADFPRENGFSTLVEVKDPNSLNEVMMHNPAGIWVDGTDEERPGLKDYDALEVVLEQLEIKA